MAGLSHPLGGVCGHVAESGLSHVAIWPNVGKVSVVRAAAQVWFVAIASVAILVILVVVIALTIRVAL